MAYGYQYIPAEHGRADREACGPGNASTAESMVDARVFRVGPAASAIAEAIAELYRDIEGLRLAVGEVAPDADGVPVPDAVGA